MYSDVRHPSAEIVKRRVFICVADKRRRIRNEQIFAVPCLTVLIQYGGLGIVAHLRRAHLMNNFASSRDAPIPVRARFARNHATGGFDNLLERFLHVLRLQNLRPDSI